MTDDNYDTKIPDDFKMIVGRPHFMKVFMKFIKEYSDDFKYKFHFKARWTVGNAPIAKKLNWFITGCTVSGRETEQTNNVTIIKDKCFADVLNTSMASSGLQSSTDFR